MFIQLQYRHKEQDFWQVWEDSSDLLFLGRHEGGLVLSDSHCSSRHALIFYSTKEGKFCIADLNSLNGTYVNGARTNQVCLREGDVINLERMELRISILRSDSPFSSQTQGTQAELDDVVRSWPEAFECLPQNAKNQFSNFMYQERNDPEFD